MRLPFLIFLHARVYMSVPGELQKRVCWINACSMGPESELDGRPAVVRAARRQGGKEEGEEGKLQT